MHELSLAREVLRMIEDAAHAQAFSHVRKVCLEIGQLAAVEADTMRFCLEVVMRGSIADGAILEITEVPGSGWCPACQATVAMRDVVAACPHCGDFGLQVRGGRELKLKALDVE